MKVRYLHSDIDTVERVEIIRDLRLGEFDVLVGINLLREGLDIPEVSLVAILDADKEGFLRSERSLIQTIGRAARNVNGRAILYADRITDSMSRAIDETERRRAKQIAFNEAERHHAAWHPQAIKDLIDGVYSDKARGAIWSSFEQSARPRSRPWSEKGLGKRDQAAREADARTRTQPGVRAGGAAARPAGQAQGPGARRAWRRQPAIGPLIRPLSGAWRSGMGGQLQCRLKQSGLVYT